MALETGEYIGNLVATNPTPSDPKSQGDDHLRLIKSTLQNSFAGMTGMVLVSGTESGSGNAYSVALSGEPTTPTAYTANMVVLFKATHANTGNCTLAVAGITAAPLLDVNGNQIPAGGIELNSICAAMYSGTSFYLVSGNGVFNAPTPAVGDNSTKIATTAFAVQLAFAAALPAQTGAGNSLLVTNGSAASWAGNQSGNSGKFLTTNGSALSWANAGIAAVSSTFTTSTTLSGTFEFYPVAMSSALQAITLPNATTLSLGGPLYVFKNTGSYSFALRDYSGTFIVGIPAGGSAALFLTANGIAAGTWAASNLSLDYPLLPAVVDSGTVLDAVSYGYGSGIRTCALSSTQFITLYLTASNAVAVLYTLSGSTVTVNSTLTVGTISTPRSFCDIVAINNTQAVVVFTAASNYGWAAVVTNTAGTLSAGALLQISTYDTTGGLSVDYLSATEVIVAYNSAATTQSVVALSIAGTTLTANTPLTIDGVANTYGMGVKVLSSTQGLVLYGYNVSTGNYIRSAFFTIAGTALSSPVVAAIYITITGITINGGIGVPNSFKVISPTQIVFLAQINAGAASCLSTLTYCTISGTTITPVLSTVVGTGNYFYGVTVSSMVYSSAENAVYVLSNYDNQPYITRVLLLTNGDVFIHPPVRIMETVLIESGCIDTALAGNDLICVYFSSLNYPTVSLVEVTNQ